MFYGNRLVIFALYVIIYQIYSNTIKYEQFNLVNKGQSEEGEKGGTCVIRLEMFDPYSILMIFQNFSTRQHSLT